MTQTTLKFVLIYVLIGILSTGCITQYKSLSIWGDGFTEKKLSSQSYLVTFSGNDNTSAAKVRELALRRCAELTQMEGFTHFLVLDEHRDKKTELDYSEVFEEYEREEEYTVSIHIFMARQGLSKEEMRRAIDARVYLEENRF